MPDAVPVHGWVPWFGEEQARLKGGRRQQYRAVAQLARSEKFDLVTRKFVV
jgi:hypothetical protein